MRNWTDVLFAVLFMWVAMSNVDIFYERLGKLAANLLVVLFFLSTVSVAMALIHWAIMWVSGRA